MLLPVQLKHELSISLRGEAGKHPGISKTIQKFGQIYYINREPCLQKGRKMSVRRAGQTD